MHTSPGLACDAGTTFQPSALSRLAVPETVLSCQLIMPDFCSTAVTKLAQLTLLGTHDSIGSSPLRLRSEALRPRNPCASFTTSLLLVPEEPDVPEVPVVPPVLLVPEVPEVPDVPGRCTFWPGKIRSGLRIWGLALISDCRPMPLCAAMPDSVSPLRTVWLPPERLMFWPGKIRFGLAICGFAPISADSDMPCSAAMPDRVSPRCTV